MEIPSHRYPRISIPMLKTILLTLWIQAVMGAGLTPGTTAWFDDIQYGGRWTDAQIKQLQKDLNAWGFRDNQGNRLATDGTYGTYGTYGDRTRFAHRMYFQQQREFLSQGHIRAEWEQHLKDRTAGTDRVPIKAPSSGTSGSGSYNATKPKCDSEQIFISNVENYLREVVSTVQTTLYTLAGDIVNATVSLVGVNQSQPLAAVGNTLGQVGTSVWDAVEETKGLANKSGPLAKTALSGVANALGVIAGALDLTFGIVKMLEASRAADDYLKTLRYVQGSAYLITAVSGPVAAIAGLIQAYHVAIPAAGLAFFATGVSVYLGWLERKYLN